jgi:ubiquinone/menaquinone biosynthesis C-methylase UbiE
VSRDEAFAVAQAAGQRVTGIDSSPAMLRQARARAAEAGVELHLRDPDLRDLALDEQAGLLDVGRKEVTA